MKHPHTQPNALFEPLEPRQLLSASLDAGLLTITATDNHDKIILAPGPDDGQIKIRGSLTDTNDTYSNVDAITIHAGDGNDKIKIKGKILDTAGNLIGLTIHGDHGNDNIKAGPGDDTIHAGPGNDRIKAGHGDDTIDPGPGQDKLNGQRGNDTVSYASAPAAITVNLAKKSASRDGFGYRDLKITGIENVIGTPFNDHIQGDKHNNTLDGREGHNLLNGGRGHDKLFPRKINPLDCPATGFHTPTTDEEVDTTPTIPEHCTTTEHDDTTTTTRPATSSGTLNITSPSTHRLSHGTSTTDTGTINVTGGTLDLVNTTPTTSSGTLNLDSDLTLRATIPNDLNGDNRVSVADLSTFAMNFNTTPGLYNEDGSPSSWTLGDFNTDGQITVADLSLLALNFGFDPTDTSPKGLTVEEVAELIAADTESI